MDNIKLIAKNEPELKRLKHTVRIYSQNIDIKFSREKCAMLVMKSDKKHITDGMELRKQDKIRKLTENETYKYLGLFEADTIKQVKIKEKIRNNILREVESCSKQNYFVETLSKE